MPSLKDTSKERKEGEWKEVHQHRKERKEWRNPIHGVGRPEGEKVFGSKQSRERKQFRGMYSLFVDNPGTKSSEVREIFQKKKTGIVEDLYISRKYRLTEQLFFGFCQVLGQKVSNRVRKINGWILHGKKLFVKWA